MTFSPNMRRAPAFASKEAKSEWTIPQSNTPKVSQKMFKTVSTPAQTLAIRLSHHQIQPDSKASRLRQRVQ